MSVFKLKQLLARGLNSAINIDHCIKFCKDRYVLSYHRVLPEQRADGDGVHPSLWITPQTLASQIRWMQEVGEIVDYKRIVDPIRPHDRPLFALTFDDGWKDNYEYAFPVLKQYQVPAHIFLATQAVDSGELFWPQDIATKTRTLLNNGHYEQVVAGLYQYKLKISHRSKCDPIHIMRLVERWIEELKTVAEDERQQRIVDYFNQLKVSTTPLQGYIMSWSEAREMQKYHVSFGSHTHNHIILEGLPVDKIEDELRRSKSLITHNLQKNVDSFCYPNGRYDGKEEGVLLRCGYSYGFRLDNISMRRYKNNYYIPRLLMNEHKAAHAAYFKLCLLGAPLYRSKPHKPKLDKS